MMLVKFNKKSTSAREEMKPKIMITKSSSENDLMKGRNSNSISLASKSLKSLLTEVVELPSEEDTVDEQDEIETELKSNVTELEATTEKLVEEKILEEIPESRRDSVLNRFRKAVTIIMRQNAGYSFEDSLVGHDDPHTVVTLLPTDKTKSMYFSRMFKYAVKSTIIKHRKEKSDGDPWDEFFYRVYDAEKPRRDSLKRGGSATIKFNINQDLERKLSLNTLDQDVKDKLMPHRSSSSGPTDRSRKAISNLNRLSANLTKRTKELIEKGENQGKLQSQKLPKLPAKTERHLTRGRFRVDKVHHSPDGRSPLSRLFYLPLIPSKPPN